MNQICVCMNRHLDTIIYNHLACQRTSYKRSLLMRTLLINWRALHVGLHMDSEQIRLNHWGWSLFAPSNHTTKQKAVIHSCAQMYIKSATPMFPSEMFHTSHLGLSPWEKSHLSFSQHRACTRKHTHTKTIPLGSSSDIYSRRSISHSSLRSIVPSFARSLTSHSSYQQTGSDTICVWHNW